MRLRFSGVCRLCGASLPARTEAIYESGTKTVRCLECPSGTETPPRNPEPAGEQPLPRESGIAGSSARREYERRKAKDEERLRGKWGRLGGLAVALSDERQSTKAWDRGAIGEERLGVVLDALASDGFAVLHDRRIPGTKANIDHIAITPGGIWVIDAKRCKGRPELKIEGGILSPRVEKLLVGRRDCTKLVDGVLKQVDVVRELTGDVPVTGALCFIDADWPLIGGAFRTRGVQVLWPKRLAKALVEQSGDLDVASIRDLVASRFRPA
ncbi:MULTISPECIES: nuclease-related domain-containing protein [Arthrobacter]|uniref:NERD domain-containing protein n=1 Tax=Arthrobacter terricola TaxID=2547396 RepID=A0A4R5KEC3_9MICC|nr:NERD domain-containing protein [Arthrobacter sp. GN70]TDF92490.1 NERD domain-containing protein [Arthrobacter terricola]